MPLRRARLTRTVCSLSAGAVSWARTKRRHGPLAGELFSGICAKTTGCCRSTSIVSEAVAFESAGWSNCAAVFGEKQHEHRDCEQQHRRDEHPAKDGADGCRDTRQRRRG
jgi:hypothetical protein